VRSSPHDEEGDNEIYNMGDDHHQVPSPTPAGSQVELNSVEAPADAAAALVAARALTRRSADDGSTNAMDNDGSLLLAPPKRTAARRGRINTLRVITLVPQQCPLNPLCLVLFLLALVFLV